MSSFTLIAALLIARSAAAPRPDIVVADFEGDGYAGWTATGTAFGDAPARGTLPGQMAVEGYLGRGLVNTFLGGDESTGRLTSDPFVLDRPHLNFLIGGGGFAGETCVNLRIDGRVVRTATGPNRESGGSERLRWQSWDVAEFSGRRAVFEIVDARTGGWGHINVDQIALSDQPRVEKPARRAIDLAHDYLHLPVRTGAPKRRMRFVVEGKVVREFDVELAEAEPSFWVFAEVAPFRGQRLIIDVDDLESGDPALSRISPSNELPDADGLYRESLRPQFHFTSRRGWLNDPNGLVWLDGEYHLFYQHNPFGWDWGNMHWGHATSPDLVHWSEQPTALFPRRYGDWCFSGSGLIDTTNSAGFQPAAGGRPPLVVAYTSTGRGECVAYSLDRGRSFIEFGGNPVVKHSGRDPKIIRHEPTGRWIMAVYDEGEGRRSIAFHSSPDLKTWTEQSRIDGFYECPDLFELPVDGHGPAKWVLHAADGKYLLGLFDGRRFVPDRAEKQTLWYGNFYAAQTFSNVPDGRRIQIGWGQGVAFPGMPFNQQMTVPCELTLRTTEDGVRMFAEPVAELERLRGEERSRSDVTVAAGSGEPLAEGDLLDIVAEFEVGPASSFGLDLRGVRLAYDVGKGELACAGKVAPLAPIDGRIRLRVLLDRGSIEVFGNGGRVAMSIGVIPPESEHATRLFSEGGRTTVRSIDVFPMTSAWTPPRAER
jgi:fructan beta-fructosidase